MKPGLIFLGLCCTLILGGSKAHGRTLYEIRQADGSVTFTYRSPRDGERYRIISHKRPRRSQFIRARGWSARLRRSEFDPLILSCAREAGLDHNLIKAVVHVESAFDPRATSRKGAMGLMQLMPATARRLGVVDPYEPKANLCGGSRYLKMMLDKFAGNLQLALAAYNAGPGAVERYSSIPPYRETIDYIRKVKRLHQRYQDEGRVDG